MYKILSADQVYASQKETYTSYAFNDSTIGLTVTNASVEGRVAAVSNTTGLARLMSGSVGSDVMTTAPLDYSFLVLTSSVQGGLGTWLHAIYGRHYSASSTFVTYGGTTTGTILDQRAVANYRGLARHFGSQADEQRSIWIDNRLLASTVFLAVPPHLRSDRLRRGFVSMIFSTASALLMSISDGVAQAYDTSTYITATDVPFFNNNERVLGASLGLLSSSDKGYIGKINYDTVLIALDLTKLIDESDVTANWFLSGAIGYSLDESLGLGPTYITWGLLQRMASFSWNSVTENTVVSYCCNASPGEFNYSSNPTFTEQQYLTSTTGRWTDSQAFGSTGKVLTLSGTNYVSTYVTGIALLDSANRPVAVARTSRPIEKKPGDWLTFVVPVTF